MKVIKVTELKQGDILAKPIVDSYGRVLLQKDIELTDRLIKRIQDFKLNLIYIKDSFSEGIAVENLISDELRIKYVNELRSTFAAFEKYSNGHQSRFVLEQSFSSIEETIKEIIPIIKSNDHIFSIISNVFVYDNYLYHHSLNVAFYTLVLAKELQLDDEEMIEIGIGALLHDIGKVKIPEQLLNKPGKLTPLEYEVVKEHTTYGYQLLKEIPNISETIISCAYEHHERLDGSGYPRGVRQSEINDFAKIITVADVFDAVTSDRSYRHAYPPQVGLDILYAGSGTKFSKEYIEIFRKHISIYPNGMFVSLSDGRAGIVAKQNKKISDRPIIRIVEEEGKLLPKNKIYEIDLAKELNVVITNVNSFKRTY
ncbi:HD-GYP domain-containing protein [Bacillaceae bacterium W0354]